MFYVYVLCMFPALRLQTRAEAKRQAVDKLQTLDCRLNIYFRGEDD